MACGHWLPTDNWGIARMIEPYTAVGLIPTFWDILRRFPSG